MYALIPVLNVLFSYGLETSYFKFAQDHDRKKLYNTLNVSIICTTALFALILLFFHNSITNFLELSDNPEYVTWMIGILFFDTLAIIPMAKLRLEERPRKYAFVNMASVLTNVLLVIFFYSVARPLRETHSNSVWILIYDPSVGVGYFIIANLVASAATLFFL